MIATDETIVNFIKDYISKNGYSPSVRDIGASVGISSAGSMKYRLHKLREKGLITFDDGKPRTIRVVGQ